MQGHSPYSMKTKQLSVFRGGLDVMTPDVIKTLPLVTVCRPPFFLAAHCPFKTCTCSLSMSAQKALWSTQVTGNSRIHELRKLPVLEITQKCAESSAQDLYRR